MQPASIEQDTATSESATQSQAAPDSADGPPSLFEDARPFSDKNAQIIARIRTTRAHKATDTYTVYPYQPKPPAWTPQNPLPTTFKGAKGMVMSTGYQNRQHPDKPYQMGGWRWVYAYHSALQRSGIGEPHTIFTEYSFARDLTPYVVKECIKRNQFEKERFARYQRNLEQYEKNHVDQENEALRLGLMPIALTHREFGIGRGQFPAGNWWLQVTRKMPGLTYYWLEPITAAPKQNVEIVLDDDNALAIVGAW